jgi:hypothetical protein
MLALFSGCEKKREAAAPVPVVPEPPVVHQLPYVLPADTEAPAEQVFDADSDYVPPITFTLRSFRFDSQKLESGNIFKPGEVVPGDTVAGMTVVAVEWLMDDYGGVTFEGRVTLTGRFESRDDPALGRYVSFFPAAECLELLPRLSGDDRVAWVGFRNVELAEEAFGPPGSSGTASVAIDSYIIDFRPTEAYNSAGLVEVLTIRND